VAKGTIVIEIKCIKCLSTRQDVPDDLSNDPIVKCADCGTVIGPYSAIKAALEGQAHTAIFGGATTVSFKPLD